LKSFTKLIKEPFKINRNENASYSLSSGNVAKKVPTIFGLFINLFNVFCEKDGINAIMNILLLDKINSDNEADNKKFLTLEDIEIFVKPFENVKYIAQDDIINPIFDTFRELSNE